MWTTLFSLTNGLAMIGWAMLALLPRKPLTLSAIMYLCIALLCLCYAVLFALLVTGSADPGLPVGTREAAASFSSIPGVRAIFQSDGGVVVGWTHYLAFDLFVGVWIAKDADAKGFSRIVQLPILFATLMAGPIGLLVWLAVREARARTAAKKT